MEPFFNFTGDFNLSVTNSSPATNNTVEEIHSVGKVAHIVNVAISFMAVLFNAIILTYLLKHRSKFPEVIFQQMLCLSVTDFIAGFTPALSILTLHEKFDRRASTCTIILGMSSFSHLAVLINLCFLSVRRWVVLRNASKQNAADGKSTSSTRTIMYIILPWLLAAVAFSPVVRVAILQGSAPLNGCLSPKAMEDSVTVLPYFAFNVISLLLLTLFYIGSILALKRIELPNADGARERRQRLQAKAFRHLVTVLAIANIVTLPSVILIVLSIMGIFRDSQIMFIGNRLQMLNSAINPLVYSFHIAEMKGVIGESARKMLNGIRVCCGCSNAEENLPGGGQNNENHRY